MLNLYATRHAQQRAKERAGWRQPSLSRMAERVLYDGIGPNDCAGSLRKYLEGIALRNVGHFARIYGEHVFVFGKQDSPMEAALVTVLHLPHPLRSAAHKARKRYSTR